MSEPAPTSPWQRYVHWARSSPVYFWGFNGFLAILLLLNALASSGGGAVLWWVLFALIASVLVLSPISRSRHAERPESGFWRYWWHEGARLPGASAE
ncbi:MAG: hypothetical protein AAGK32_09025 [Actinomycetota bacterium]